jgi:hypothetical protein
VPLRGRLFANHKSQPIARPTDRPPLNHNTKGHIQTQDTSQHTCNNTVYTDASTRASAKYDVTFAIAYRITNIMILRLFMMSQRILNSPDPCASVSERSDSANQPETISLMNSPNITTSANGSKHMHTYEQTDKLNNIFQR